MNIIDIKELNIPNLCFSLDNDNKPEYKQQRIERGFDDSETWSLTDTISNFIIPRLERYIEIVDNKIGRSNIEKQNLQTVLEAFKLIVREKGSRIWSDDETRLVERGLKIFPKIFLQLWW
jgi:hypothetical protein